MASLKRLSTDEVRVQYWDGRLKYYRKLLSAYGTSFWPAKFAATALDHMAKNLTKTTAGAGAHAGGGGGGGDDMNSEAGGDGGGGSGLNNFTSPSTPWSGVSSYEFFPHSWTSLNEIDFDAGWWMEDAVPWSADVPNATVSV